MTRCVLCQRALTHFRGQRLVLITYFFADQAFISEGFSTTTGRQLYVAPDGASSQSGSQPGGVGVNDGECGVGKLLVNNQPLHRMIVY